MYLFIVDVGAVAMKPPEQVNTNGWYLLPLKLSYNVYMRKTQDKPSRKT